MSRAIYAVHRYSRATGQSVEVVASGLTHLAARNLAAALRPTVDDAVFGFTLRTMPLREQVDHYLAGETMNALAGAA